ncbi:hypothetical protein [Escherichia coli]|uniref:hypothetical protein n=1 Tax=Escherichia coli TaxID=562 RepID=UPI00388D8661
MLTTHHLLQNRLLLVYQRFQPVFKVFCLRFFIRYAASPHPYIPARCYRRQFANPVNGWVIDQLLLLVMQLLYLFPGYLQLPTLR